MVKKARWQKYLGNEGDWGKVHTNVGLFPNPAGFDERSDLLARCRGNSGRLFLTELAGESTELHGEIFSTNLEIYILCKPE